MQKVNNRELLNERDYRVCCEVSDSIQFESVTINKEEVRELITCLKNWVDKGVLFDE